MRCESCGHTASALKTVRWKTAERRFLLCDECYALLSASLWVVCGRVPVWGFCSGCSNRFSVRELSELRPSSWKWDAPSGLCPGCASG